MGNHRCCDIKMTTSFLMHRGPCSTTLHLFPLAFAYFSSSSTFLSFFFFCACLSSQDLALQPGTHFVDLAGFEHAEIHLLLLLESWQILSLKRNSCWAMVVHAFNPSTREAEAGGSLSSRTARAYTEKPCLKNQKRNEKTLSIYEFLEEGPWCSYFCGSSENTLH